MVGIVKVGIDNYRIVKCFGCFGKQLTPVPVLPQVVPGRGRVRVVVGEAAEKLLVVFEPLRDGQAVQQLLHPGFVVGVEAQALLVVPGRALELLPALVGQAQVEVNVLPLGVLRQASLKKLHGPRKLAPLGADDAARDGHVGIGGVEGRHLVYLALGLGVVAAHGHHLGAVHEQLGRERVLAQGRLAGLQGLVKLSAGDVVVDDVLKVL